MPHETTLTEFPDMRLPSSMMSTQPPKIGGQLRPGGTTYASPEEAPKAYNGGIPCLQNSDGELSVFACPVVCLGGVFYMVGGILKLSIEAYSCGLCCGLVTWPKLVTDMYGRGACQAKENA